MFIEFKEVMEIAAVRRWIFRLLSVSMAGVLMSACAADPRLGGDRQAEDNSTLEKKMEGIAGENFEGKVADFTDFSWDQLGVFNGYSRGDHINEAMGFEVARPDYGSSLDSYFFWVFAENKKVVRVFQISFILVSGTLHGGGGRETKLVRKDGGLLHPVR